MTPRELAASVAHYRVEVSAELPYEYDRDDGSRGRTDYIIDHVNQVVLCSRAAFKAIEKAAR